MYGDSVAVLELPVAPVEMPSILDLEFFVAPELGAVEELAAQPAFQPEPSTAMLE